MNIRCIKYIIIILAIFIAGIGDVQSQPVLSGMIRTNNDGNSKEFYSDYTRYIEYCVRLGLQYNNIKGNHHFSMQFTVENDGRISSYDILNSSDDSDWDKLAIGAIINSGPFKSFPQNIKEDRITYQVNISGGDVSVSSYSYPLDLEFKVDQSEKPCRTVEIVEAKSTRTMSYFPYYVPFSVRRDIKKQIKNNWYPQMQINSAVGLSFRVYKDGKIDNIKIFRSSDFDAADDAAIEAVNSVKIEPWTAKDKRKYAVIKYGFHVDNYMH